jgi:hypothetical protein
MARDVWTSARAAHGLFVIATVLVIGGGRVEAQARDGLVNGGVAGAAVGAGLGVVFTHVVRDSDLTFAQYARGAAIFGAIGAGVGVGVDALMNRAPFTSPTARQHLRIAPAIWRDVAGVTFLWRW